MTTVTVAETVYTVTVADDNYTVTVADSQETVNVSIASAAADTQVINSGSGTSLIKSSTGGVTTLRSVAGGNNVTLADDGSTITISATEDDLSNNTTDNLSEGSTNQYFTDARVMTALETVSGHVIPSANVTYDLGSTTSMWRDAYIGPGSLYINGQKVISSDTGEINITTDANENLNIQAGGDITVLSAGLTTNIQDTTVNLGPANNTGTTNVRGTLDVVTKIEMGDTDITSGQIHQDSTNGDLTLKTNGTGRVIADTSNLVVGTLDGDNTQITPTGITGTLTGTVSSIANHTTANLTENTNLYYTDARADARAQLKIDALVDSAPGTLDTLNELAAALGDDANFSTTVTNSIATKLATADFNSTFDTRLGTKDTDNISEGSSNLYYTDARFNTAFGNKSTSDLTEGTNLYYTDARFDTRLGTKDTGDLTEGSNLYYTDARFNTAFSGKSTTDLSEGSNLYYTDARARSAISLSSSNTNELSYDSSTGVITYTSPSTVAASGQIVFDVRNTSGVDIARGDAVYISGHSGSKILVAKADANVASTMPAIGLANSAMSNNSDGSVLIGGEMTSIDTSAFSVGDVLYVSETAGELTATRPSAEATKIQNIGKVARSDNQNGIIIVVGSGRANDVPNLTSGHVFIGDGAGYETRQLTTADLTEDASNKFFTDARAIAAVEGESTLALGGAVTVAGLLTASDTLKVDDGFTQTSFNPYGAGNNMPTTVAGIGQEDGWASLHVRSRGEHDFGIGSQYNLVPRALMALSAGRKDGSSDDYLNNNDTFGAVMYNPYSGYRTGTEWLTPSATIYGVATEDHSASGMGTKLDFSTTENTNKAGAADLAHTNGVISFQGTTITSSGTLKIDDDLIVTGSISDDGGTLVLNDATDINGLTQVVGATNNKTVIGDQQIASTYNITGVKVQADETKWANVLLQEYEGGAGKPASSGFTNPTFGSEVIGGTVASPGAVSADKRLFVLQSLAANATDGTLPTTSNFRILAQTSQAQTSSNRGTFVDIDTTADDANGTTTSLRLQGATVNINPDGNGVLKSGGDLTLDDNVIVTGTIDLKGNISNSAGDVTVNDNIVGTGNLTINGNTVLGDSNADTITCNGKLTAVNGFVNTILDVSTANALAGMGLIDEGAGAYISDGNAGSKCFAVFDGTNWKVIAFGNNISSS